MTVENAITPVSKGFRAEWAEKNKLDLSLANCSVSEVGAPELSVNHKAEYIKKNA